MKLVIAFGFILLFSFCNGEPSSTVTIPTPSDWFECPGDGCYVNPYDCGKFFMCSGGNAWAFHCPAHLYFNQTICMCEGKYSVNCQPTVTPGY